MSKTKLLFFGLTVSIFLFLALPKSTSALTLNLDPGPNGMPANLRSDLQNCDTSGRSPGFSQWVSLHNAPTTTTFTVAYEQTSVQLDYHFAGVICYSNSAVPRTQANIVDTSVFLNNFPYSGSLSGIKNQQPYPKLDWGSQYQTVGAFRSFTRTFTFNAANGGFKDPGTYKLRLDEKVINEFTGGVFGCVPNGGSPNNLNDFNSCNVTSPTFSLYINVPQPDFEHRAQVKVCDNDPKSPVGGIVQPGIEYKLCPLARNLGPDTANGVQLLGVMNQHPNKVNAVIGGGGIGQLTPAANQGTIFGSKKGYSPDITACDPEGVDARDCWWWGVQNMAPDHRVDSSFTFELTDQAEDGDRVCFLPFIKKRSLNVDVFTGDQLCFTVQRLGPDSPCPDGADYSGLIKDQPDRNNNGINDVGDCYDPPIQPYLRVYGNDVMAGGGFGEVCQASDSQASVEAFAKSDTVGGETHWIGASSQFATFALGAIDGFYTSNLRGPVGNTNLPRPPLGLTFGNTVDGTSQVVMNDGGNSGITNCIPDYFSKGTNVTEGDSTIATTTVAKGQHTALYFHGNVHITGTGIRFEDSDTGQSWGSSISSIPSYYLIVKGNIYINPSVTQLDGIYIAQPEDGVADSGIINTCTNATGGPLGKGACDTPLQVNGAFIARQVRFTRTAGDLTKASGNEPASSDNIAEVFNFSPESYLSQLDSSLKLSVPLTKYDYVTSLPPIL